MVVEVAVAASDWVEVALLVLVAACWGSLTTGGDRLLSKAGRALSLFLPSLAPDAWDLWPVFCLLEKLSAAVAALLKLLRPVLMVFVLVADKGRSFFCRTVGRLFTGIVSSESLTSFEVAFGFEIGFGGVDDEDGETTGSDDRFDRDRLKTPMNLYAVGGTVWSRPLLLAAVGLADIPSGESMLVLGEILLCWMNETSDMATPITSPSASAGLE